MRRPPGPAGWPLCDGVKTPEAHVEMFRGWQRTQTQSSVRTLRSLRQQMDVWFCLMQKSSAERRGTASQIIEQRQNVLDQAYVRNPERFVRARPKHPPQPTAVWINPPTPPSLKEELAS